MFLLEGVDPDDRDPEEQSVEPLVNVGPRRVEAERISRSAAVLRRSTDSVERTR